MLKEEYLGEWFDIAITGKSRLREWFIKYANIDNFSLIFRYKFNEGLRLEVTTYWEGCDNMLWWTDGRNSDWEGDSDLPTLEQIEEELKFANGSAPNEVLMELVTGYLHSQVLPQALKLAKVEYMQFCKTITPTLIK